MKLKKIFDLFPPPQFLDIPYSGLSISDTSIRCIQFGKNSNGLYVKKFTERPIPHGAVTSGYINNPEEIVNILLVLKKELNLGYLKVSLPEEKAYLFTTKIPRVKPSEVRNTIEFNIEENVPLPASELIFDYSVADLEGNVDHVGVIVSALPTKIIDKYVETFQKADIPLLSLEIESQAMARCLIPKHTEDTRLIVHFGREKVGLYIAYKRIIHFTSTVGIASDQRDDLGMLSQEIKKLYLYWHTLKDNAGEKSRQISSIIICGENVDEKVAMYLTTQHGTPAVLGNVWTNAFSVSETVPTIPYLDSLRYAASVGLALPNEILI